MLQTANDVLDFCEVKWILRLYFEYTCCTSRKSSGDQCSGFTPTVNSRLSFSVAFMFYVELPSSFVVFLHSPRSLTHFLLPC